MILERPIHSYDDPYNALCVNKQLHAIYALKITTIIGTLVT